MLALFCGSNWKNMIGIGEEGLAHLCTTTTRAAPSVAVFDGWEPRGPGATQSKSPESHSGLLNGYQPPPASLILVESEKRSIVYEDCRAPLLCTFPTHLSS